VHKFKAFLMAKETVVGQTEDNFPGKEKEKTK